MTIIMTIDWWWVSNLAGIGQCKSTAEQQDHTPWHTVVDGWPVQQRRCRAHFPTAICTTHVHTHTELVSASEMTYIVSRGALNSTHSLGSLLCPRFSTFFMGIEPSELDWFKLLWFRLLAHHREAFFLFQMDRNIIFLYLIMHKNTNRCMCLSL